MNEIFRGLILIGVLAAFNFVLADADIHSDGELSAEPVPIFVYSVSGNPDLVNADEHGTLIDWLESLETRSNKPDEATMFDVLIQFDQRERFQNAFARTFSGPSESCHEVFVVDEEPDPYGIADETVGQLFADHDVSRAWVFQTTERANKEGYVFTVHAIDFEVSAEGIRRIEELMVWHRDIWSDGADAHSRGLDRDDRKARPKIGSHEARAEYWQAGSPPRIERLIDEAPGSAVEMLRYLRAYSTGMTLKEYKQKIKSFEMIRNVDLHDGAKCRASRGWCKFRVVDKTEDRVRTLYYAGRPWMISINIPGLY